MPKYMSIEAFRQFGFLQEANRLFFHPRGLVLEAVVNEDGTETLGGVWDYRDDAEGIVFADAPDGVKADMVEAERSMHDSARIVLLGQAIQQVGQAFPAACAGVVVAASGARK